jgi:hypothetical protein
MEPSRSSDFQKQSLEMISIEEGIQIEIKDQQRAKAALPRVQSVRRVSNSTTERAVRFLTMTEQFATFGVTHILTK